MDEVQNWALSNTKNKLIVVGCDTYAYIEDYVEDNSFTYGLLGCGDITNVSNGSCTGIGCCDTSFPKANSGYIITLGSFYNHTRVWNFNSCSYAFVVENGIFDFSSQDLKNLRNKTEFPLIMNWAVENKTCNEAKKNKGSHACKDNNVCVDSDSGLGYLCRCKDGFEGNPYLNNGCQGDYSARNISQHQLFVYLKIDIIIQIMSFVLDD